MSARINTIKARRDDVLAKLKDLDIPYETVDWYQEAVVLPPSQKENLRDKELIEHGEIYQQGLSSMLVPLALDVTDDMRVLDLCAAPGSKTSQLAALMRNTGEIVAVENVRKRFYRLKAVLDLLGVNNINCILGDGRRVRCTDGFLFDRVLVDAPCSSEGRFSLRDDKTYRYWGLRKIKEMVHKQRGLLLHAGRLLRPDGILVYSTCTFAPEENEGVVDWFLRKTENNFKVEPVPLNGIKTYPCLTRWHERQYYPDVARCARILPDKFLEGFFIAKFRRVN